MQRNWDQQQEEAARPGDKGEGGGMIQESGSGAKGRDEVVAHERERREQELEDGEKGECRRNQYWGGQREANSREGVVGNGMGPAAPLESGPGGGGQR